MQALPSGNEIVRRTQNTGKPASGSRAAESSTLRIEGAVPGGNDEHDPNDGGVTPNNKSGLGDEDDSPDEYDPQDNNDPRELQNAEMNALMRRFQALEAEKATERALQEDAALIDAPENLTTGHPEKFRPFERDLNHVRSE